MNSTLAAERLALKAACIELGLQDNIELIAVHGIQWMIRFTQEKEKPDFVSNMLKLEQKISQKVGRAVDLRLEPRADKNKRFERTGYDPKKT